MTRSLTPVSCRGASPDDVDPLFGLVGPAQHRYCGSRDGKSTRGTKTKGALLIDTVARHETHSQLQHEVVALHPLTPKQRKLYEFVGVYCTGHEQSRI